MPIVESPLTSSTDVPARCDAWREAGVEPRLDDVLADPLVHLVMRRDRLTIADVQGHVMRARLLLRRRLCCLCAA